MSESRQTATFAEGCFWGVEVTFRNVDGVTNVTVGYTGGHADQPTYEQVCEHGTGHAEAVEIEFDPEQVSYEHLLDTFFGSHDPTTMNRQGPDVGDQYRSAIFYHDEVQRAAAEAAKERWQPKFEQPIVTEITPATTFWPAEDYHQMYLVKRGVASCKLL